MSQGPQLILASCSPRRVAILESLGFSFITEPANVDETPLRGENPLAYVLRMARTKAATVAERHPGSVVVAADTPVLLGRRILQAPSSVEEAEAMLKLVSGRRVQAPTVVVVADTQGRLRHKVCRNWLKIARISTTPMKDYLEAGIWRGCSGGIQFGNPVFQSWTLAMHGSYSGIMGLPVYETVQLLRPLGLVPKVQSGVPPVPQGPRR